MTAFICILIVTLIMFGAFFRHLYNKQAKLKHETKQINIKEAKKVQKAISKNAIKRMKANVGFKYPHFIPYHEYKGWRNGLQPSTKNEILKAHGKS